MPEEIKQEVVLKTQKYLGKYVKKPPLTEKLLKKPPFRFLHDIINTVIKETGFLKGLFSSEELNSENVKEKDAKVAFLSKLIDAVKVITSTDLAVKPSKIVAGLEPTETNLLLQTIGKAIEKKVDSSEYVKQLHSGEIIPDKSKKTKKTTEKTDRVKKPTKPAPDVKVRASKSNETPKSTDREKTKTKRTSKETKSKDSEETKPKKDKDKLKKRETKENTPEKPPQIIKNETNSTPTNSVEPEVKNTPTNPVEPEVNATPTLDVSLNDVNRSQDESTIKTSEPSATILETPIKVENEPRKRSASASRPKSARPRSGDVKEKEENKEPIQIQSRPKTSLRPPSVRPSSARPGAPRLRPDSALPVKEVVPMGKINVIVENFDKDDEEETVVIQSNPEVVEEPVDVSVAGDNKGQLVEQILEQINKSENKSSLEAENDWQKDMLYGKDSTTKETNNLKSLIQTLTKTANPLGKLLNYVHEDIDAMQAELELWTHAKRQLFDEISKQKKISAEMNKPLVAQLEHLTQEIRKIEDELVNTRSNILRNDMKIKELLSK